MNNIFDDMTCLVNTDSIFPLDYVNIEELWFWPFLEGIVKDSVKFLN